MLIAGLGLPWRSRANAVLANGTVEQFDIYAATVLRRVPGRNSTPTPRRAQELEKNSAVEGAWANKAQRALREPGGGATL